MVEVRDECCGPSPGDADPAVGDGACDVAAVMDGCRADTAGTVRGNWPGGTAWPGW